MMTKEVNEQVKLETRQGYVNIFASRCQNQDGRTTRRARFPCPYIMLISVFPKI